eukprot:9467842-Pyramimonas_sp.AAC.3
MGRYHLPFKIPLYEVRTIGGGGGEGSVRPVRTVRIDIWFGRQLPRLGIASRISFSRVRFEQASYIRHENRSCRAREETWLVPFVQVSREPHLVVIAVGGGALEWHTLSFRRILVCLRSLRKLPRLRNGANAYRN